MRSDAAHAWTFWLRLDGPMRCGSCPGAQLRAPDQFRCCSHFSLLPARAADYAHIQTHTWFSPPSTKGSPMPEDSGANKHTKVDAPQMRRWTGNASRSLALGALAPRGGRPILIHIRSGDSKISAYYFIFSDECRFVATVIMNYQVAEFFQNQKVMKESHCAESHRRFWRCDGAG